MLLEESKRPGGLEEFDKKDFSCKYRALEWAIESTLLETKILCSHAELILNRANNAAAMVSFAASTPTHVLTGICIVTRFDNYTKQPTHSRHHTKHE